MAGFGPDWWHHHGTKVRVSNFDQTKKMLYLSASAADIEISVNLSKDLWDVKWRIIFSSESEVNGIVQLTTLQLGTAFALASCHYQSEFGDGLLKQHDAEFGEQGKFIRRGKYLNIPGPGTGHDGDPNVSIRIDDEITINVLSLIESRDPFWIPHRA